jgi:malate dehydrogenase
MRRKVSVIGAGKVGATTAHLLALKGLADIVLVNRTEGIAQGVALDIRESLPIEGSDVNIVGTGDYSKISGSDIVVVTAGAQRKEGMSRDDLLKTNAQIVSAIAEQIKQHAPNSIVIVVSNPLDAMAYLVMKKTGFDRKKVIGMAGALDSARLTAFIAEELKVTPKEIKTMILGSHGDSMVPVISATTVNGYPVSKLIGPERLQSIVSRARDGGAEIIKLEGSSAFYAPASSVVSIIDSILNDRKKVIPCSVYLEGEYGIKGTFLGVPIAVGKGGIETIETMPLSSDESKALSESAAKIAVQLPVLSGI